MTHEEFIQILEADKSCPRQTGDCKVFLGLEIIRKYLPKKGIAGANHDIIYSVYVSDIADAGITPKDAEELRNLGWMTDEENAYLACYV